MLKPLSCLDGLVVCDSLVVPTGFNSDQLLAIVSAITFLVWDTVIYVGDEVCKVSLFPQEIGYSQFSSKVELIWRFVYLFKHSSYPTLTFM